MTMEAPPDLTRGEDVLAIPLGANLRSEKGHLYVFIGWRATRAGCEGVFVRAYQDQSRARRISEHSPDEPLTYHASIAATLIRKFPGLADFDTRGRADAPA